MQPTVAIIGYGAAAVNAIIALRLSGYEGPIDVFAKDSSLPYSPILTSYYAGAQKAQRDCFPWTEEELAALSPTVHEMCPCENLDPVRHEIATPQGTFTYTKCLIASGSSPTHGGFPSSAGYKPLVLRTMQDAQQLKDALGKPHARMLVSGTSMVAFKAVEACLNRSVPVTLLGRSEHTLRKTALAEMAARFEAALQHAGVEVILGQTVNAATPHGCPDSGGSVEIEFSSRSSARFSDVLIAHGMIPNLQFVEDAGLESADGLVVDEFMRTTNPDVYAAGDVAQVRDLVTGGKVRAGLWKEACLQGACAGKAIAAELGGMDAGRGEAYHGALVANTLCVQDITLVSGGNMRLGSGRHIERHEQDGCDIACVIEEGQGGERLIGFNVFCDDAHATNAAHDIGAMLHKRLFDEHSPALPNTL